MSEQRYVLVPREVTDEICAAIGRAADEYDGWGGYTEYVWQNAIAARPSHYDDLLKAMESVCDEVGKTMSIETPKSVQEAYARLSAAREKVAK